MLENPGIPLPFRIQTNSLKVLDLKFKVLEQSSFIKYIFSPSTTAQYKQQPILSVEAHPLPCSVTVTASFISPDRSI
ncbi:hypothetical protein FOXYSP1_17226 [Fusarium oxysporum f. sp. phaseoli]